MQLRNVDQLCEDWIPEYEDLKQDPDYDPRVGRAPPGGNVFEKVKEERAAEGTEEEASRMTARIEPHVAPEPIAFDALTPMKERSMDDLGGSKFYTSQNFVHAF